MNYHDKLGNNIFCVKAMALTVCILSPSVQLCCSFVSPTSFVFGDEDLTPVECYTERFNYTYKVSIRCSLRSVQTEYKLKRAKRFKVIHIKCVKCKSSIDSKKCTYSRDI